MKILWIVNMVLPDLAEQLGIKTGSSGTWMIDISRMLSKTNSVKLAIACVWGKEFKKLETNNIVYYLLPGNGKNMLFYTRKYEDFWKKINEEFQPDIVHLHGTEYSHGVSFLRVCPDVKAIVSVQGILNRIKEVDFGELPIGIFIWNRTLNQNLHLNGEIEMHFLHKKNARYEREILRNVDYINGVNTWDISLCKKFNPNLTAFKVEYNLRDEMYESRKWDLSLIRRHTIFTNPGGTPLKGLHQLVKAVALLKDKYPDILVQVPGMGVDGALKVTSAYSKYIQKLIKQNNLEKHIVFLGRQNGLEMCQNMLGSHVTVIPSAIEGTSLILREAMFLGCPCIASFRGGMADFIADKTDGFLYDYREYQYLASRIDQLFSDDFLCEEFSQNAIKKASQAHDRNKNLNDYLNMYEQIIQS